MRLRIDCPGCGGDAIVHVCLELRDISRVERHLIMYYIYMYVVTYIVCI